MVACTDRKCLPAPSDLLLRHHYGTGRVRLDTWIERLGRPTSSQIRAVDLYQGEHWRVASRLPELAAGQGSAAELWVASAGYGVLAADDLVESYGATFASGASDSVSLAPGAAGSAERECWWQGLARRPGGTSLTALAAAQPTTPMLVVVSGAYARAMAIDLLGAEAELRGGARPLLVSVGSTDARLRHLRVPADARFQHLLGGTRLSLNARVAAYLVERAQEHGWNHDAVVELLSAALVDLPPVARHHRSTLSDADVSAFIRSQVEVDPRASKSVLLRRLRDRGRACEQGRFGRIFDAVRSDSGQ